MQSWYDNVNALIGNLVRTGLLVQPCNKSNINVKHVAITKKLLQLYQSADCGNVLHAQKLRVVKVCWKEDQTINGGVLSTFFNTEQVVEPESSPQSGVTMLNNIVHNIEQYGQHNIVQSCFQQLVIFLPCMRGYLLKKVSNPLLWRNIVDWFQNGFTAYRNTSNVEYTRTSL